MSPSSLHRTPFLCRKESPALRVHTRTPSQGGTGKAPTPPWHPNPQEQRTSARGNSRASSLGSFIPAHGGLQGGNGSQCRSRAKAQIEAPSCPHLVPCPSCPGVLEDTHFLSLPMNKLSCLTLQRGCSKPSPQQAMEQPKAPLGSHSSSPGWPHPKPASCSTEHPSLARHFQCGCYRTRAGITP